MAAEMPNRSEASSAGNHDQLKPLVGGVRRSSPTTAKELLARFAEKVEDSDPEMHKVMDQVPEWVAITILKAF